MLARDAKSSHSSHCQPWESCCKAAGLVGPHGAHGWAGAARALGAAWTSRPLSRSSIAPAPSSVSLAFLLPAFPKGRPSSPRACSGHSPPSVPCSGHGGFRHRRTRQAVKAAARAERLPPSRLFCSEGVNAAHRPGGHVLLVPSRRAVFVEVAKHHQRLGSARGALGEMDVSVWPPAVAGQGSPCGGSAAASQAWGL